MTNETNHFGPWQPWQAAEAVRFFSTLTVPWWIAGGWALDLFLGGAPRNWYETISEAGDFGSLVGGRFAPTNLFTTDVASG
jgi:hypothetical protein